MKAQRLFLSIVVVFAAVGCSPKKKSSSTSDNGSSGSDNNTSQVTPNPTLPSSPSAPANPVTPPPAPATPPSTSNPSDPSTMPTGPGTPTAPTPPPVVEKTVRLVEDYYLRTLQGTVLFPVDSLPEGAEIIVNADGATVNPPYRNDQGQDAFSSTGFLPVIRIKSIPASDIARFPESRLRALQSMPGGLFLSARAMQSQAELDGDFPAMTAAALGDGYKSFFEDGGQPKFNFSTALAKRFARLNRGIDPSTLSSAEKAKWDKIMSEVLRAVDRTHASKRRLLLMEMNRAFAAAQDFEKTGHVSEEGAWMIAVEGTAKIHDFQNVPSAELVGEILRQAYVRAGFTDLEDFNERKGNRLNYASGAWVVDTLALDLDKAGWVPWDASVYAPPTGAIMFHGTGRTPGHVYLIAGDRGRFIIDNGMPQGRDLRSTSKNSLEIMYQHGFFFLPPGWNPSKW